MRKLLMPLLLVPIACDAATVAPKSESGVYDFRLATTPPRVLRWPSGTPVRVLVNAGAGARAAQLEAAFTAGAAKWNRHALYAEYELVQATSVADADVVLQWSDAAPVVDMTACPYVISLAVTTFCLDTTDPQRRRLYGFPLADGTTPSRVRMVATILGTSSSDSVLVSKLVTHELGHVLGIARHTNNPQDLMFGGQLAHDTLTIRDIATVQVLYHTQPQVIP